MLGVGTKSSDIFKLKSRNLLCNRDSGGGLCKLMNNTTRSTLTFSPFFSLSSLSSVHYYSYLSLSRLFTTPVTSSRPITMSTLPEPKPKQKRQSSLTGQAMSAVDIEKMNRQTLLQWIQQNLAQPLNSKNAETFLNDEIDGRLFLASAGSIDSFKMPVYLLGQCPSR